MDDHAMQYRAGTEGLSRLGIPDAPPHWYCQCGGWSFVTHPNSARATGNNEIEARKAFQHHVTEDPDNPWFNA